MKNNTLKSILSSILVISLCISLIAGSTFALFTSESGVNIAVNAGKVDVVATIDEASLKTWSFNVEQEVGKFELGGTATVANGAINLSKMAPGDEAQVTIKTENNSDINIQYRVKMVAEGVLAEALVATATINGIEYDMKTANSTVWKSLVAGEQIGDIVVTIEFPNTDDNITDGTFDNVANNADNKYQGKEATAYIVIEAVQGNAQTTDSVIDVTAANFAETLANLENDTTNKSVTLNLTEDVEWETGDGHGSTPLVSAKTGVTEIVIQGNGHTITATGAGVDSIRAANGGTLVFRNVNFVDKSVSYNEDAWEFTYLEFAGKLVFENCTFNSGIQLHSETNEADAQVSFTNCKFKSEVASEYSVWVSDGKVSFTNCTFTGTRGLKTHEDYGSNVTSIVIDNCKFGPLSEKPGVVIGTLDKTTKVTIKNSVFADVKEGDQKKYIYETDTVIENFIFVEENNIVATTISTAEELLDLAGKSVEGAYMLTADIDLNGVEFAAIGAAYGKSLTIYGNGHTISNAKMIAGKHNGMDNYGLFYAYTNSTLTIKDLVIENVNVSATSANYGAAVVVGYADDGSNVTLNNVDVNNCTVVNDYDEATVYVSYQTGTLTMKDCDSTGCSVNGATDVKTGAFIGCCNGTATLTKCTTDLTIGTCNRILGTLTVDGGKPTNNATDLKNAVNEGKNVVLENDITADSSAGGYNVAGLTQTSGGIIDGKGNTLTVNNANGTWDCAIYTNGGTIKNLTIDGAFRGIFTAGLNQNLYIDNVVIDNVCYTISADGSNPNYEIVVTNSTINGWTSYTSGFKAVSFEKCNFGKGTGGYKYAYCRPYNATTFTDCTFEAGYEFDATATNGIVFENCYVGETLITAENITTLLGADAANVTVSNG